jgi:hypothetical protein
MPYAALNKSCATDYTAGRVPEWWISVAICQYFLINTDVMLYYAYPILCLLGEQRNRAYFFGECKENGVIRRGVSIIFTNWNVAAFAFFNQRGFIDTFEKAWAQDIVDFDRGSDERVDFFFI